MNSMIVVLPGDNVTEHILGDGSNDKRPKLGRGLTFDAATQQIHATVAGRFLSNKNTFYILHNDKHRYRPAVDDRVVGILLDRFGADPTAGGDLYRVEIGASHPAILSNLTGFEGATKRNRPTLKPGQVVYARVAVASAVDDTVLSCKLGPRDVGVTRKDWMTNEGCYGELKGGTVFTVSTGLARELLHTQNVVLKQLADAKIAFEVAVGVNGKVWVHSSLPQHTVLIQNAILNSEVLSEQQIRSMVKSLVYTVEKQRQQNLDAMEE